MKRFGLNVQGRRFKSLGSSNDDPPKHVTPSAFGVYEPPSDHHRWNGVFLQVGPSILPIHGSGVKEFLLELLSLETSAGSDSEVRFVVHVSIFSS